MLSVLDSQLAFMSPAMKVTVLLFSFSTFLSTSFMTLAVVCPSPHLFLLSSHPDNLSTALLHCSVAGNIVLTPTVREFGFPHFLYSCHPAHLVHVLLPLHELAVCTNARQLKHLCGSGTGFVTMNLINLSKRLFWSILPSSVSVSFILGLSIIPFALLPIGFHSLRFSTSSIMLMLKGTPVITPLPTLGLCTLAFTALQILSFSTLLFLLDIRVTPSQQVSIP